MRNFNWLHIGMMLFTAITLSACSIRHERVSTNNPNYYRDGERIYFCLDGKPISNGKLYLSNVNLQSFELIDSFTAKDCNYVYFYGKVVPNADPTSFRAEGELAHDNSYVYLRTRNEYKVLHSDIDPQTAHILFDGDTDWLADSDNVYYDGKVTNLDLKTIRKIGPNDWVVDKHNIYFPCWDTDKQQNVLWKVDTIVSDTPQIISEISPPYLRNGKNIIWHGFIALEGVDIKRIEALDYCHILVNDTLLREENIIPYTAHLVDSLRKTRDINKDMLAQTVDNEEEVNQSDASSNYDDVIILGFIAFVLLVSFLVAYWLLSVKDRNTDIPKSVNVVNSTILAPTIFAPIVTFLSCFIDNPPSDLWALILFASMNTYWLWLLIIVKISRKVWRRSHNKQTVHSAQVIGVAIMVVAYACVYLMLTYL